MRRIHTNDSLNLTYFVRKYKGWHSFAKDKRTLKAVERAKFLGVIEVNEFNQMRAI